MPPSEKPTVKTPVVRPFWRSIKVTAMVTAIIGGTAGMLLCFSNPGSTCSGSSGLALLLFCPLELALGVGIGELVFAFPLTFFTFWMLLFLEYRREQQEPAQGMPSARGVSLKQILCALMAGITLIGWLVLLWTLAQKLQIFSS